MPFPARALVWHRLLASLVTLLFLATGRLHAAEIRVVDETMFLDGEIKKGDAEALKGMLDAHPAVTRLSISSPGGDLHTGLRMGALVRKRALETYVEGGEREAASAAAYVFMGGEKRVVKGNRGIGVHAFYTPTSDVRRMIKQKFGDELIATLNEFERATQESTMAVVEYVMTMVGDTRIVAEAVKSGSAAMLWPDAKRLLDMKVATSVVELTPEEVPDLPWFYGAVIERLGTWLDAQRDNALSATARDLLEAFLADDERMAKLHDDLAETLARDTPANRTTAETRLVEPIVSGIIEQIRTAAQPAPGASDG
ncbi:MAG: hypothetical protein SGJ11_14710 [Phycisphaerae bacterium]|nr:hypothetical protein [Phycisphaerae bacterium]